MSSHSPEEIERAIERLMGPERYAASEVAIENGLRRMQEAKEAEARRPLRITLWTYQGKPTTAVWPLLDALRGSQHAKLATYKAMKQSQIGFMTTGHEALSDFGRIDLPQRRSETFYAHLDDVLATMVEVLPRLGPKLVADFRARLATVGAEAPIAPTGPRRWT